MALPPLTLNAWLRYAALEAVLRDIEATSVLDIGAGAGAVGARLARRYPSYLGVEPDPVSCARAQARLGPDAVLCGDLSVLDPGATFDLAVAIAVLEHMEDDAATLGEWHGRVRPGGRLVVGGPTFKERWGAADELAGHYRRYEPDGLESLLAETGFQQEKAVFYGFGLGYALEHGRNALARRYDAGTSKSTLTASSGRRFQPPDRLGWATWAATLPFRRLQALAPGRGTGIVVLARRE